jgi:type II secretory pathway component GspD/PulD (secretin)
MKILQELEQFINEFNQNNNETFMIDSIRIKNGVVDSFCFDMANETVRQSRLDYIAIFKAS